MEYSVLLNYIEGILGKSSKKARDNYAFHCPFCNHRKPKLEINFNSNEKGENPWECWVCRTRGRTIKSLLFQLKIPKEQAQEILKFVKKGSQNYSDEFTSVTLPKEFKPLCTSSTQSIIANKIKSYLYSRGLTDLDFIKYNIGYCTSGLYSGRIIIPSYDSNNKLNYFVARTYENSFQKYKNPSYSRDIIFFENMINWNQPVILVEGVFDAFAVKRNVIPILGKNLSKSLLKKLITSSLTDVYIALDNDAKQDALQHSTKLLELGKNVYLVDIEEKDPSVLGFKNFTQLVYKAEPLTTTSFLKHKIQSL